MVVRVLEQPETDRVFHALADATRRDIVSTVLVQELSVSALARRSPSTEAVQQMLEEGMREAMGQIDEVLAQG